MRMLLALLLVGACAGDETDVGKGPVCSGMLYDNCAQEHDCMSNECRTYTAEGYNVCTQQCSASVPCPDKDGMPVTCDMASGVCKIAPRDCRVLP
ncbi:MAG: hypothetical protein H0T46_34065 [Deltaproteobacteria bacterium]|nr:hypothetical protein [Deltaproteobacteria bacterium]